MGQAPFGRDDKNSLQYHFFCGEFVCAVRVFRTRSLDHNSAWVYDGRGSLHEILRTSERLSQSDGDEISLHGEGIVIDGDRIELRPLNGQPPLTIRHRTRTEHRWGDTISTVLHLPDMNCEIEYDGRRYRGIGYCKRYSWTPSPRYWGYRFIQGYAANETVKIWTAEATFGEHKYDYFKIITPDGELLEAASDSHCHREDTAYATIQGKRYAIALIELDRWEAPLVSDQMDSLLRQRVCRLSLSVGGRVQHGFAINETCYGTLG